MNYTSATELVQRTMDEVFDFALDREEMPNSRGDFGDDDNDGNDILEAVEGWNSEAIDTDEQLDIAINGFPDNGFDQPVALREAQRYERQIAERDRALERLQQQNSELQYRADPHRQAREAQEYENLQLQVSAYPDQAIQTIHQLQTRIRDIEADRVNASLGAWHRDQGPAFEEAYHSLTSMDPTNPTARALIQDIWSARDPGQRLMQVYYGSEQRGRGGRGSHLPPSLNSQTPAWTDGVTPSARRSMERRSRSDDDWPVSEDSGDIGGYEPQREREVFASIWA